MQPQPIVKPGYETLAVYHCFISKFESLLPPVLTVHVFTSIGRVEITAEIQSNIGNIMQLAQFCQNV